jgi:hypothetical protein
MKILPGAVVEVSCGGNTILSLPYCDDDDDDDDDADDDAVGRGSDIILDDIPNLDVDIN